MISKVNVTLLRQFQDFNYLSKLIIWLTYYVFFISLFRIVSSMNHFQLHVFNISKVNVTLLSSYIIKQFLDFYCLS